MYSLKPYYRYDEVAVTVPDGMYKLKNMHSASSDVMHSSGEAGDLDRRQEAILERLEKLKQEIHQLSQESGVPIITATSATSSSTETQDGVIKDIVVNADPDKPPLSLFIILNLLSQSHKLLTNTHVHSSVTNINPELKNVFLNGTKGERHDYQIGVTLVWKKEDSCPSLMVDPHMQSRIIGEANIARYVSRLLAPAYDSGDAVQATLIDNWLDIATHQLLNGNSKEKSAAVRNLNSRLGKNEWLTSQSVSLADVVVWSALYQSGQTQDAPANVKKWFKSCSNLPQFQLHKTLLS